MQKIFELLAQDRQSKARHGRLTTAHGAIETPAFVPVGTQGSVKAVSPRELRELNAPIVLGNTYHLFVRPGIEVIKHFGGLHKFMTWNRPILTDSGGYQIFSLAKLRKISENGVHFQNHVDGSPAFISPESAMEIQAALGSDIAMVLDECPPWPCEYDYAAKSAEMTTRWAKRCKDALQQRQNLTALSRQVSREENAQLPTSNAEPPTSNIEDRTTDLGQSAIDRQLVFGIVQGATFGELRQQSAQAIVDLDFDGYAIGGVSVGEPEEEMFRAVESSEPFLPNEKPRYAMGLGTPPQLKNAEYAKDRRPIEEDCVCSSCREFSRGYVRHLIKAEEILGLRLITLHNLHFYLDLMRQARDKIDKGAFDEFRREFVSNYETRDVDIAV